MIEKSLLINHTSWGRKMSLLVGEFPVSMHVRALYLRIGLLLVLSHIFVFESKAQQPDVPFDLSSSSLVPSDQGTDARERVVSLVSKNESIGAILKDLARQANINITYSRKIVPVDKRIESFEVKEMPISQALNKVLEGTDLIAVVNANGHAVVARKEPVKSFDQDTTQMARGSIKGKVIDSASKSGIAGVTVQIVSSSYSSVTDENGTFELRNIPLGSHRLSARVLGFVTRVREVKVTLGENPSVIFTLVPTATSLSEVVTTATGQQRRVEVAHDIAKIDASKIMERTPVRNVTDILEAAQVPGVLVQRSSGDPGSPSRIRIRGISSISQSNDPVVILDGIWVDNTVGKLARIDAIDPATIETIEIIRGPSAATLYGQDASNGVIVITTKKGRAGTTRWNVGYKRDWGQTYGSKPLEYKGFGFHPVTGTRTLCNVGQAIDYSCIQDSVLVLDPNNPLVGREGTEMNDVYTASVEGGTAASTYSITLSRTNTTGVRRTSPIDEIRYRILGYEVENQFRLPSKKVQNNVAFAYSLAPRENLSIGLQLSANQSNLKDNLFRNFFDVGIGGSDPRFTAYSIDTVNFVTPPSPSLKTLNTIYAEENPLKGSSGTISSTVSFRPGKNWIIGGSLGAEKTINEESNFSRRTQCRALNCYDTVGSGFQSSLTRDVYTVRMNVKHTLQLGPLSRFLDIKPSLGGDFRRNNTSLMSLTKDSIPAGYKSMDGGRFRSNKEMRVENASAGWYLNSTIGLLQRIYFDIGFRQDIGSAITSSANTNYPKIGGSWLVSDESFWRQNNFINLFRFRAAIGHAAVQPNVEDVKGSFVRDMAFINGIFVPLVVPSGAGNSDLAPERATEVELGFDADLLYDKLNVILTYARSINKNSLISRRLPPSTGMSLGRKENIASVMNRNLEMSFTARVIENRDFQLSVNSALTIAENKVGTLGNVTPFFNPFGEYLVEGYPIGGVWTQRVLGYKDRNQDDMISNNEIILSDSAFYSGWSQPRFKAGYGLSMTVRRFTLDSRFAYQSKYVQRYTRISGSQRGEDMNTPLDEQAIARGGFGGGYNLISDLRWNSASISYHVPGSILSRIRARSLTVSLQGSNLGLWTDYVGRDPGVNSGSLTLESTSDDGLVVPRPRLFVLNFNLGY